MLQRCFCRLLFFSLVQIRSMFKVRLLVFHHVISNPGGGELESLWDLSQNNSTTNTTRQQNQSGRLSGIFTRHQGKGTEGFSSVTWLAKTSVLCGAAAQRWETCTLSPRTAQNNRYCLVEYSTVCFKTHPRQDCKNSFSTTWTWQPVWPEFYPKCTPNYLRGAIELWWECERSLCC